MRGKFFMPKNSEGVPFYGLFRMVEGERKVLNTYVVRFSQNRGRLREVQPLGRFLRFGEPVGKDEKAVENPAGFGKLGESKFVFDPIPWWCPHTAMVANAVCESLNPRFFLPLKEETIRYIKSRARCAHMGNGGKKTEKVSVMKGTEHFFEVRRVGNPNLLEIIDEEGKTICKLDAMGLLDPDSEISARARELNITVRTEGKLLRFFKVFSVAKIKRCEEDRQVFMFGDAMPNTPLGNVDPAKFIRQILNDIRTTCEAEITQAEAAFRLHTLDFLLREKGLSSLPADEKAREEFFHEKDGYIWRLNEKQLVPLDARDKDGERVTLDWDARTDTIRWMPTFAEFKEAEED